MTPELQFSGSSLLLVLLGGAGLYVGLRYGRALVHNLPLNRGRKQVVDRFRPLVEAVLTVGYALLALRLLLGAQVLYSAFTLVAVGLLAVAVSWFVLRDVLAGLLIKASELCLPGDTITVGELRGRVRGLGTRVVALDTDDGGQAFVPYTQLSRQALVCHPAPDGAYRYSFRVHLEEPVTPAAGVQLLRRHILNSHWSSVVREPQIFLCDDGSFHVTLFALADHRGPAIEASLRRLLDEQGAAGSEPK
jgi:hypothetical protein